MHLEHLTEESKMTLGMARKFANNELAPIAAEIDQSGEFPIHLYRKMGELGLLGVRIPPEYGGTDEDGAGMKLGMLVNEEIARVSPGFVLSAGASTLLFANNVLAHGSHEQKSRYLPPIVRGEAIGCWGLTEPGAGSDALGITTKAVRNNNGWILDGRKMFITNAPIADFFIIIARTDGKSGEIAGGTAFLLDRDTPGLSTGKPLDKMGMRCSPTGEIILDGVQVSDSQVLGTPGSGFFDMMRSLDLERAAVGAIATGIAQACLDISLRYARERRQFGRPIASFQLIQEKIATIYRDLRLARIFTLHVLEAIHAGRSSSADAASAKWFASEIATRAALETIQILGGYGYCREYAAERMLRDAKLLEIGAGTTEINKILIARGLIGK